MKHVEPITEYLKRQLKSAGAAKFDAIAEEAGVHASFIRKFFYGSRENPRVQTVQPLIDYFQRVELGERSLPKSSKPEATEKQATQPERRKADLEAEPVEGMHLVNRRAATEKQAAWSNRRKADLEAEPVDGMQPESRRDADKAAAKTAGVL